MLSTQKHLFAIPKDIAYFNTAYMSPLMNSVVKAIDDGTRLKATPWLITTDHFFEDIFKSKRLFGLLVNAPVENIAVIPSASYGLTTAANNLTLKAGERIIALKHQFPSHSYPWKRKARKANAIFHEVEVPDGNSATDSLLAAMDERTAIVAVPNVLWTTGAYVDLLQIRARCDEIRSALVLDLTQSAGALVTDFKKDPS